MTQIFQMNIVDRNIFVYIYIYIVLILFNIIIILLFKCYIKMFFKKCNTSEEKNNIFKNEK